jgi:hypothetical protein
MITRHVSERHAGACMRGSHTTFKESVAARTDRERERERTARSRGSIHAPNIFQSRGATLKEALQHDAQRPLNMVLTSLTERGRITPSRSCSDTHLLTVQHHATTCLGIQPPSEVQQPCAHSLVQGAMNELASPMSPQSPVTHTHTLWGTRQLLGIHPMRQW